MTIIKSKTYDVFIGNNAFKALNAFLKKGGYRSYFIICDENTLLHCLPPLVLACPALAAAAVIEIESGEESKSLEFTAHILQTLIEDKAGADSLIINLGGGVVSDLGGFAASIYKRGIPFINIPTSLLAMADASVGGKTAIDFAGVKNSVGTFAQPAAVFVNPLFLNTLPPRHYANGLAEIFKIALVSDKTLWKQLKEPAASARAVDLITRSIGLKNKIVLKDPFDKELRKTLNFGHTLGHAIESICLGTKNELLHGEAIAIGMIMESHLACQKKMITKATLTEITEHISLHLALKKIDPLNIDEVIHHIQNDKKSTGNNMLFALIQGIGSCAWNVPVTRGQVQKAIDHYKTVLA